MKKLFLGLLCFGTMFTLSSCQSNVITKISEEVELTQIQNTITDVYATVSKGCVGIITTTTSETESTGSGVIYKEANNYYYVVTNAHVVNEAVKCSVTLGGLIYYDAEIIGVDKTNDIAVIKFTLDLFGGDVYINDIFNYTDNDLVTVGQTVLAIGCPLGTDNFNILTTGVVSSVNSSEISTDAALNPGNSGGGLFNMEGRLIGINYLKSTYTTTSAGKIAVEGRGFTIPLSTVKNCILDIEGTNGDITRPTIGITVAFVQTFFYDIYTEEQKAICKYIPEGASYGFIVNEVIVDSYGYKAGLAVNDALLAVDGTIITSSKTIPNILHSIKLGDSIELKISRIINSVPTEMNITVTF